MAAAVLGTVVADLDLRPERRHTFVSKLLGILEDWVPGSVAELHGSLGSGTADDYSDIDIRARSVAAHDLYDADNPDARSDTGWSSPTSAIEHAIAAIKAAARGQADSADGLLRRGCERIGVTPSPPPSWPMRLPALLMRAPPRNPA